MCTIALPVRKNTFLENNKANRRAVFKDVAMQLAAVTSTISLKLYVLEDGRERERAREKEKSSCKSAHILKRSHLSLRLN